MIHPCLFMVDSSFLFIAKSVPLSRGTSVCLSTQSLKDVLVASRCQQLRIKLLRRSVLQAGGVHTFSNRLYKHLGLRSPNDAELRKKTASQSRQPPLSGCEGAATPQEPCCGGLSPFCTLQGPWWLREERGPLAQPGPCPAS